MPLLCLFKMSCEITLLFSVRQDHWSMTVIELWTLYHLISAGLLDSKYHFQARFRLHHYQCGNSRVKRFKL